jgi:hypothetical protein
VIDVFKIDQVFIAEVESYTSVLRSGASYHGFKGTEFEVLPRLFEYSVLFFMNYFYISSCLF